MTVAEIQSVVAMYLQRSVAKFDVTGTGANLILVAMNNARKYAERRHNWSVCRKKGYLSVTTANEVAWDSPTWFGGGTEKMKEGKHWWLRGDATDVTNKVSTTDCPVKPPWATLLVFTGAWGWKSCCTGPAGGPCTGGLYTALAEPYGLALDRVTVPSPLLKTSINLPGVFIY